MKSDLSSDSAISRSLDRVDWDFADENPSTPNMRLNGVHWYPATFVAPLIGTLLDILAPRPGASVFDPFAGSGTAVLEAWYRGHRAAGADSNTFAVSLSKARVTMVRQASVAVGARLAERFETWSTATRRDEAALSEVTELACISPEAERWFVPRAVQDIALAKIWVESEAPRAWRAVLRVVLSSLLKRASRVRDYHYTYIVDRSRVKNPALEDPQMASLFADKLRTTCRAAANLRAALQHQGLVDLDAPPSFTRATADGLQHVESESVDLILTSPPYFGMNDYVRSQYLTSLVYPSSSYGRDLELESGSRRNRDSAPALDRYLRDMRAAFEECQRMLRRDALIAIFLGHSRSRLARESDVVGQLAHILDQLDFTSLWRGERRIRFRKITSTPSSTELVWILRRG